MSRSGYTDDCENNWDSIRYAGAVKSSIRGRRGQELLKEMLSALDAMPVKELVAGQLEADGEHCALGVLGVKRGISMTHIDPLEADDVADAFGIAEALAREIVSRNDDYIDEECYIQSERVDGVFVAGYYLKRKHVNADRWKYVRDWVASNIKPD